MYVKLFNSNCNIGLVSLREAWLFDTEFPKSQSPMCKRENSFCFPVLWLACFVFVGLSYYHLSFPACAFI
jgi:hypothetical protein